MNHWNGYVSDYLPPFFDAGIKSFPILAGAAITCLIWRRASAATRHLVWFLALLGLPCVAVLSLELSSMQRPLLPISATLEPGNQVSLVIEPPLSVAADGTANPANASKGRSGSLIRAPLSVSERPRSFSGHWLTAAFAVWLGGAFLILISLWISHLRLRKLIRNTFNEQRPEWTALTNECCRQLGIVRAVTFVISNGLVMPMTWGWRRPVILLPAQADEWPAERRRVVLLHELAHVKRWDYLTQLIARIITAFYWLNPLVWVAARRMCAERERACDDLVLEGGCKASDYAAHLIEIARTFRTAPEPAAIGMARTSGLERRVTAALDARRNRQRVTSHTMLIISLLIGGFALILAGCVSAMRKLPPDRWFQNSSIRHQLISFIGEKRGQAIAGAKAERRRFFPEYKAMFDAAEAGNWAAISNIWERLRARAPQYEDPGPKDDQLHGTAWQTICETWGAFGNIASGGEKLVAFGLDTVESIPSGSIYFGGTDPGRFVITALQRSHIKAAPFFTLTQNALADNTYLGYIRGMYGNRIYTPTEGDSKKAFDDYIADAKSRLEHDEKFPDEPKQIKPGESVKLVDGKVQVSGQISVMAINALLAKIIFDKNPGHEFYVEESFPLDWMYPHLMPHGPILKLNRQPLKEISDSVVKKDREYWTRAVRPLIGDWLTPQTTIDEIVRFAEKTHPPRPDTGRFLFLTDDSAINSWASKLRSSIAGLYAWRMQQSGGQPEKERMAKEAEFAFKQAWAVCPYSPEALFRYVNLLVSQNRVKEALPIGETALRILPWNSHVSDLVKELKRLQKQ